MDATIEQALGLAEKIVDNVEKVIVGKRAELEVALIALMCQGHMLIDDVTGVGKTTLAKSIARSLGLSFKRIQFTPDLLPSDVTGVSVYNQKNGDFEFHPGPVVAQIVLADEVNRASPKTQSSLLECMEEKQITVDGTTYKMPQPFLVIATQNPIEYEGTFPLPQTQLDRFLLRLKLGYPSMDDEITMMDSQRHTHPIEELGQVVDSREVAELQGAVRGIHLSDQVKRYVVTLVEATRHHPSVYLGSSPRGSLALSRMAQARALLERRDFALPDDVKALAELALAHRLILTSAARMQETDGRSVIAQILESVPVPGAIPG